MGELLLPEVAPLEPSPAWLLDDEPALPGIEVFPPGLVAVLELLDPPLPPDEGGVLVLVAALEPPELLLLVVVT
jgi:hypothetical protein